MLLDLSCSKDYLGDAPKEYLHEEYSVTTT